jgi:dTDP-glucose 4,6-dehydratase
VRDVVRLMCERLGKEFEVATRTVGERPGQDAAYVIDSTKARTELGWRPEVALDAGLAEVVDWVNEYWLEIHGAPLEYRHAA